MTAPVSNTRHYSESDRLAALARYDVMDTPRERELDDIVSIAAQICDVPIAMISLLDGKRQWFKAAIGVEVTETPRDIAFCDRAIAQVDTMIVEDTQADARFIDNPLVTGDPHLRFYAGTPLLTPDGMPLGTLCVLDGKPRTLTADQQRTLEALGRQVMTHFELRRLLARKRSDEKELRESETRGRLALEAAELGAWEAIPATSQVYGDARARELLGHDVAGELSFDAFLAHIHADDRERFAAAVGAVIEGAHDGRLDLEFRISAEGSDAHWRRTRAQVIKLPGERHRLVGTIRDISAERAAEEHRKLLNNELQHRVKNTLGVVQGIVTQSLRLVATPAEARDAIASRLSTLAHAHDLLTQTSWKAAPITAIIEGAVLAHCADPERVTATGPRLELKARSALALSMALHELFTNAVKYGSLSNATGTVSLVWTVTPMPDGSSDRIELVWQERGGPPVVAPTRVGFGTRLTGSSLAGDLGGPGTIDYAPTGVRWSLSTTVAAICSEPVSF